MRRIVVAIMIVFLVLQLLVHAHKAQRDMPLPVPTPVQWLRKNSSEIVGVYPQSPDKKSTIKPQKVWGNATYINQRCFMAWKADTQEVYMDLKLMNPEKVTVLESDEAGNDGSGLWQVRMYSTNKEKAVEWFTSKGRFSSYELRIVLRDTSMAERFAKAFRDAFTECGGKPDSPEPY